MAEPTPLTPSEWRELCSELLDRLRWYIQEDDTNRGGEWEDKNAYWIKGQERAIQTVERASAALGVDHCYPAPTLTAERLPEVSDCDEHRGNLKYRYLDLSKLRYCHQSLLPAILAALPIPEDYEHIEKIDHLLKPLPEDPNKGESSVSTFSPLQERR